jgi:predicted DsbA family dithiol-disulfide isomerase
MGALQPLKIEVISDVVCPWCYIAKRRLDVAIALAADVPVELHHSPFLLKPDMPREGIPREDFIDEHFSSLDAYRKESLSAIEAAHAEGLTYRPDLIKRQPSTIDSHRLIRWAGQDKTSRGPDAMERRLMKLFLEEGADLSDQDVLVHAAHDCGLNATRIRMRLTSDEDVDIIKTLSQFAFIQGIASVPAYIIADKYEMSGAVPSEHFASVIRNASAELNGQRPELGWVDGAII